MSRLGKKPIMIPEGVEVKIEENKIVIKGPKGTLSRRLEKCVEIELGDKELKISVKDSSRQAKLLWGSYASHIKNMMEGATKGFEKKLLIEGVGYRAQINNNELLLNIGFSHPVVFKPPEGVSLQVLKNAIIVNGADKEKVSLAASNIRALKKPEPYKGKGIRYEDEIIKRKAGKKAVGSGA